MTGKIDPETGLTARRVAFVQAYVANGMNATQAAITAGYAEEGASQEGARLLAIDKVGAYVAELSRDAARAAKITPEWVLGQLVDTLEEARQTDKLSDANKATELLGKYLSMWTDKLDVDGAMAHSIRVEFEGMDDA